MESKLDCNDGGVRDAAECGQRSSADHLVGWSVIGWRSVLVGNIIKGEISRRQAAAAGLVCEQESVQLANEV